jgi:hypothetical protein
MPRQASQLRRDQLLFSPLCSIVLIIVLNRGLEGCNLVQNRDNFRVLEIMTKWPISREKMRARLEGIEPPTPYLEGS